MCIYICVFFGIIILVNLFLFQSSLSPSYHIIFTSQSYPILGKTDIEFSYLKDENIIEGWFPLQLTRSSALQTLKMSGSIKLKLQWIYTIKGYYDYIMKNIEK